MGESFNCTRHFFQQTSNQNQQHNYNNNNNNNNNNINNNYNENYSFLNNLGTTEDRFPEYWKELREQKQFCDAIVTLPSGNNRKIHRIVLSSCSQYFKAIFTYNTNSSPLGKKKPPKLKNAHLNPASMVGTTKNNENGSIEITEVSLDVSDATMEAILDYAYTGSCNINWSNVEDLLASSDRYQIIGIVKLCCKFLHEALTSENCIGIYLFAKNYFCTELENLAKIFILRNFTTVMDKSCELKQLDGNELKSILSDERLNVKSELIVFDAVKYWVECDPQKRLKWISELLPCIRFGLLGNKPFREYVMNWKYISESMDFQKIILPLQCKPRIPNQVIMVVGGWVQGGPTNIIEIYDTRADLWLKMRHTDTLRAYHGVCTIDQKIYVLGGFNGFTHYNSMRCFDPVEYKWEEKACMYHPRCYVSVAVLERKIYALGGYDGHTRLNSVERYDPDKNQWEILSPMRKLRSDAAAVAFGDHIYVVGGFNGSEVLNSCEMYDKDIDNWTLVSFMLSPRSGVGLVACNDYLYAIGGFSGHSRLNSVERYSPKNPKWSTVAEMMLPRSNFATAVIDGIIYVIGGFNGSSPISFVEQYDPTQNIWKAATQMNYSRSAPSACVLSDLPNIKAYSLQCFDMGDDSPCFLKCESIANRERLLELGVQNDRLVGDLDIGENNNNNTNNIFLDGAAEPFMNNNYNNN